MHYLGLIASLAAVALALPGKPSHSYHCDPKDPVLKILEQCEGKVAAAFCSAYLSIPKVTKGVTKTVYVTKDRTTTKPGKTITSTVLKKISKTLTTITSTDTTVASTETDTFTTSTTESDVLATVTSVASTETDVSSITTTTSTETDVSTETDTLTTTTVVSTDFESSTTTTTTIAIESVNPILPKRDDKPQDIQPRTVGLPPYLHGKAPSAVSSACSCLNVAKATTTSTKTVTDTIHKTKTDSLTSTAKKTQSTTSTRTVDKVSTQSEVSTTSTTQLSTSTQTLTTTSSLTSTTTSTQTSDVAFTSDTTTTTITTLPVSVTSTTTSITTSTTTSTILVPSCATFYIRVDGGGSDDFGTPYVHYNPSGNGDYNLGIQDISVATLFSIDPVTLHLTTTAGVVGSIESIGTSGDIFAFLTVLTGVNAVFSSAVTCSGTDVLTCKDSGTGASISELCSFYQFGVSATNAVSLGVPAPAPGDCVAVTFSIVCYAPGG